MKYTHLFWISQKIDQIQLKFHIIHAATGNINQPVTSYSSHKHKDLFHLVVFTADNEVTFSLLSSENDQAVCSLDFTNLLKTFSGGEVKDLDQLILLSERGRAGMSVYFNHLLQGLKQKGK